MGTLITILSFLPALINIVREIEAAVPREGEGPRKLQLILDAVEDIAAAANVKDKDKNVLLKAIPAVVARIVTLFNALGIFKTSAEASS